MAGLYGDLVRVVHDIAQDGARRLREHGFTPAQYRVLLGVEADPGCAQQALSSSLGVTRSNISMLVTRLEDAGLVARVPHGAAYGLTLTERGREVLARLKPDHARFMADRFSVLSDEDVSRMRDLLARL